MTETERRERGRRETDRNQADELRFLRWTVTISAAVIAVLLGIIAYFWQKQDSRNDEAIAQMTELVNKLTTSGAVMQTQMEQLSERQGEMSSDLKNIQQRLAGKGISYPNPSRLPPAGPFIRLPPFELMPLVPSEPIISTRPDEPPLTIPPPPVSVPEFPIRPEPPISPSKWTMLSTMTGCRCRSCC